MPNNISNQTIADGNGPDPEELETRTSEELDIPLPEKVSHDFDATGERPDDEEIVQSWKEKAEDESTEEDENEEAKEDESQGDEGVDDPAPAQRQK